MRLRTLSPLRGAGQYPHGFNCVQNAAAGHVPQGVKLLEITQNRITEKQAIVAAGIEVAPYTVINKEEDILNGLNELGYPAVLKTARWRL